MTDEHHVPVVVPLADGRQLTVRHIESGDLPAVRALHERLSPEAVYRRFFTAVLPAPSFFDRLATVSERGGLGLVAILHPGGEMIAEVDVEPLADGNGELAIVVDGRWRGWLGPYLVELAAREAAQMGIPNLEAEVLSCNRPMRAVTRARGEAILPSSDWQEVRVVFSTDGSAPSWPPTDRPRVLVEQRGVAFDAVAGLEAAGFAVVACAGRASGRPACPLLGGERCPLADGADAVLVVMPPGDHRDRLVAAHRAAGRNVHVVEPSTSTPITGDRLVAALASDPDVRPDLEHPVGRQPEEP